MRSVKDEEEISEISKYGFKELKNINWNISYYLGTGIGLEQEEIPTLEPSNFNKFKENMIISLHPQTYSDKGFRPYNQRYYMYYRI